MEYKPKKTARADLNSFSNGFGPCEFAISYSGAGSNRQAGSFAHGFGNSGLDNTCSNENDKGDEINLDELQKYIQIAPQNALYNNKFL